MDIERNREGKTPLYAQIRDHSRRLIRDGGLRKGEALPSERKLALRLSVDRGTITAAYRELEAVRMVTARVGRGTELAARLARWGGKINPDGVAIVSGRDQGDWRLAYPNGNPSRASSSLTPK